jgi:DNA repair exonuclease SbcCD ATPase subunit
MHTTNFPESSYEDRQPRKNTKNVVIVLLAVGFIATWGYLLIDQNKTGHVIEQNTTQIAKISDEKNDIRKSFDQSLTRLDSMAGISTVLKGKLTEKNNDISKKKAEIRSILNKKNATDAELAKAKELIAQLNDKIGSMEQDVARLTQDKQQLTTDKMALVQDTTTLDSSLAVTTVANQGLEKQVDIASTLNATNIAIVPVDVKSNGKEKITTTAKRVNKLLVKFDVNNRIAQSGTTDVYVVVTGPDGKSVMTSANGTGTFTTRNEGDKSFTAKVPVDIETAKTKNVQFAFTPGTAFVQGNYTIQIYQNGFKIGEGTRELKKGGLFS